MWILVGNQVWSAAMDATFLKKAVVLGGKGNRRQKTKCRPQDNQAGTKQGPPAATPLFPPQDALGGKKCPHDAPLSSFQQDTETWTTVVTRTDCTQTNGQICGHTHTDTHRHILQSPLPAGTSPVANRHAAGWAIQKDMETMYRGGGASRLPSPSSPWPLVLREVLRSTRDWWHSPKRTGTGAW